MLPVRTRFGARDGSHGFAMFGIPCRASCGCRAADTVGGVGPTLANRLRQAPTSTLRSARVRAHVSCRPAAAPAARLCSVSARWCWLRGRCGSRRAARPRLAISIAPRGRHPCRRKPPDCTLPRRKLCCRCHRLRAGRPPTQLSPCLAAAAVRARDGLCNLRRSFCDRAVRDARAHQKVTPAQARRARARARVPRRLPMARMCLPSHASVQAPWHGRRREQRRSQC